MKIKHYLVAYFALGILSAMCSDLSPKKVTLFVEPESPSSGPVSPTWSEPPSPIHGLESPERGPESPEHIESPIKRPLIIPPSEYQAEDILAVDPSTEATLLKMQQRQGRQKKEEKISHQKEVIYTPKRLQFDQKFAQQEKERKKRIAAQPPAIERNITGKKSPKKFTFEPQVNKTP